MDAENQLTVVTNTTANPDLITTFYYNGDGARVKKAEQNGATITTTLYAGAIEVISTTQLLTKTYYSAGGQLIAVREVTNTTGAGKLTYLHSDHLGSTSLVTSITGTEVSRQSYYAYGAPRNQQSAHTIHHNLINLSAPPSNRYKVSPTISERAMALADKTKKFIMGRAAGLGVAFSSFVSFMALSLGNTTRRSPVARTARCNK